MRVRALTLLGDPLQWDRGSLRDRLEEWASELEERSRFVESSGYKVASKRIALPGLPRDDPSLAEAVADAAPGGVMISIGHTRRPEVLEAASSLGLYSYALMEGPEDARRYAESIVRIASKDPVAATRVGVSAGGHIVRTAYFPMASGRPRKRSYAAALLYPSDLAGRAGSELSLREALSSAFRSVEGAIPWAHIDYSLSPWMEESAAAVVEEVSGAPLPSPGSMAAIGALNSAIRRASGPNSTGFNEVMLPVEEDSRLKRLAKEGSIRVSDLMRLASVCLAGVDMAVVSAGVDEVSRILLDARALSAAADKPLGVRLIPVADPPGSKFELGEFGDAYAISI